MSLRKTVVTWPSGGEAWFYTDVATEDEAEMVVNFLLHRDYDPVGVAFATATLRRSEVEAAREFPTQVYCLDGSTVRSYYLEAA